MDRELISQRAATFLNLRRLPASLDVDQAAVLLGVHRDSFRFLIEHGSLGPLGNPSQNGVKMFLSADVLDRASDRKWMHRAHKTVREYQHGKNAAQRKKQNRLSESLHPVGPVVQCRRALNEPSAFALDGRRDRAALLLWNGRFKENS